MIAEDAVRRFLGSWGPEVAREAGDVTPPDFAAQCDAILEVGPAIVSSIMGLYPDHFVTRMKANGIKWFATATTVSEAKAAEDAGADAIIAQGMEAGGHRGAFEATNAEARLVGLFSLLPAVADAVKVPVIAAGGIGDGRGLAAAILLGASAVQVGTAFLRCPEAKIPSAWADAIGRTRPEDTMITRWFSGRRVEASQPLTSGLQLVPPLRLQPRIRCNEVLHRPCAMLRSKRTTLTAFKPGLANRPQWQNQKLREMSSDDYGTTRKPCFDSSRIRSPCQAKTFFRYW